MTQYHYDLSREAWIPVRMRAGNKVVQLGLRDVLRRAHEIIEVQAGSPLETIALYRLLLALGMDIFPETAERSGWKDVWKRGQFAAETIEAYFDHRNGKFDLLDANRPFYQHPEPLAPSPSAISRLFSEAASGNNPTLFSHEVDTVPQRVPLDVAARALVAVQATALGGGVSKPFNLCHAPLVGQALFWVRGNSLFEALLLNAPPVEGARLGDCEELGRPTWDRELTPINEQKRTPDGYLDYLTWQSRRIRLVVEQSEDGRLYATGVWISQGDKVENLTAEEPMAAYDGSRAGGIYPLGLRKEKALWRDSTTILKPYESNEESHAPRTLEWVANARTMFTEEERSAKALEVDVFGMVNDKAKLELWRHERMPVYPIYFQDPERRSSLDSALANADQVARVLHSACQTFARHLRFPGHDPNKRMGTQEKAEVEDFVRSLGAERQFWSSLEVPFFDTLRGIAGDEPDESLDKWRVRVRALARNAYRESTESLGEGARVLRAFAEGEQVLNRKLAEMEVPT